ncbi:MAG: hypothetical protein J6J37_07065 [Bacteroidaceae bacterium]|nr:hypothetical protein [Bacteroidaceae bacterium]
MRKFTLLFTMFIACAVTLCAQDENEGGEATGPSIYLLEDNNQVYTELQYFTVGTDADRLEISGKGEAKLVQVSSGQGPVMTGYPIGYTMALLETPNPIKAAGEWKVVIPEGYYNLEKDSVVYPSPAFEMVFKIGAPEDFKIVAMDPENNSTVSSLSKVLLTFNYPPMDCYDVLKVVNASGDSICAVTAHCYDEENNWYDGWLTMRLALSDTIVAKGTYYIQIPDSTIKKQADQLTPIAPTTLVFHVDGSQATGILPVVNNAVVGAIYDLTGRRVEQITTPGVYIVNGRKRYIK